MKYVKQFLIILAISFAGEVLRIVLPFPIPASIYGMILLFMALMFGFIKLDDVKETGKLLIDALPVMFIPAGVGLLDSWEVLSSMLFPACIITMAALVTVFFVTGRVSQAVIRYDETRKRENRDKVMNEEKAEDEE